MQGISGMSAKNLNYFRMIPPIHHKTSYQGTDGVEKCLKQTKMHQEKVPDNVN
jgi:hypothetical protein